VPVPLRTPLKEVVTAIVPELVTGELVTVKPVGIDSPTEVTVPPELDDAMVIAPFPLVMVTFDPAVKVALVNPPAVLPMRSWPSV
jgi:hypothetical protein